MASPAFKTCPCCVQSLPVEQFSIARGNPDGRYSYCKKCDRSKHIEKRRRADPEWAAARDASAAEFEKVDAGEIWKDIPGWEGWYQASSKGRIRSLPRIAKAANRYGPSVRAYPGKVLKLREANPGGHLMVGITREGVFRAAPVHRLVCEAFHGLCPDNKQHCAHWDGNPANNAPDNLRWATVKENSEDARRHGTLRVGVDSNLAKLDEKSVLAIRAEYKNGGTSYRKLGEKFGVSSDTIYAIVKRRNWKHI